MGNISFKKRILAGILAVVTVIGIIVATNLVSFADETSNVDPNAESKLDEALEDGERFKEITQEESKKETKEESKDETKEEEKKEDAKTDGLKPKPEGKSISTMATGTGKAAYVLGTGAGQVSKIVIKAGDPKNVVITGSITSDIAEDPVQPNPVGATLAPPILPMIDTGVVIDIEPGWGGKVTLNNVNVTTTSSTGTPMRVQGNASDSNDNVGASDTVEIILAGTNNLYAGMGTTVANAAKKAALEIRRGSKVIISGPASAVLNADNSDTRDAAEGGLAAAIGASTEKDHGHIIINGGTINANGGYHGAGIGGSWILFENGMEYNRTTGNILIYGKDPLNPNANPVVNSTGGGHSAGIGGGCRTSGLGQVVILAGASVTATAADDGPNKNLKGGLGAMSGFFYISTSPTTQGALNTPKLSIKTDRDDKNIPLFLDLSQASSYWDTIQLIPEAQRPVAKIVAFDGAVIHDGKLTMDWVPFGTTGTLGVQERYVHITAGDIAIKTPQGTPAGDSYFPYTIENPIVAGGPDVEAILLTPRYAPTIEKVKPGLDDIDYDYTQEDVNTQFNVYKISNGNGPLDNVISDLEVIISNEEDYIWELVDANGTPVSGDYPTTLGKGESFYIKQSIKPGKDVGVFDGYVTFKGEEKVSKVDGKTYPTVIAYDPAIHDLGADEPYKNAGFDFETAVKKLNLTTFPNDYFDVKADVESGKINLLGGAEAEANGILKNEILLNMTQKSTTLTNQTVKYRISDENGNPIPGQAWQELKDGELVSFPDDGKYKIQVEFDSDQVNAKHDFGVYEVDITKPSVSSITHTPEDPSTAGFIDRKPTNITVKFDEDIVGLPEDAIKTSSNIKINSITPTGVPGEYTVEIQVLPGIKEDDEITFEILGGKTTDPFFNDNLSSTDSGASLQPSGKLIFKQGDPSAYINDYSSGHKFVEKLDELKVSIVAAGNDDQGLYKQDRVTPIDLNDAKNLITVIDKKTGLPLPASEYTIKDLVFDPEIGADVTIEFPNQLDSGDYVVEFKKDVVYNKEGKTVEEGEFGFEIKRPIIDGATIGKDAFDQKGGDLSIKISGENLTEVETIVVKDNKGNVYPVTIIKDDENNIIVKLPENKSYDDDDVYEFDIYINEGTGLDTEAIIPVKKPGETGTHTKVVVDRAKTILNFNLNGADSPAKVPSIIQDKDDNGGKFDFTAYDYKNSKQPLKKDHMFVGWYLDKTRIKEVFNMSDVANKGGEYTLIAKWIDMAGLTKPPTDPGKPGVPGDGSSGGTVTEGPNGEIITEVGGMTVTALPPAEDTSKYPGENTKAEIEKELGGDVVVKLPDGSIFDESQPEFVWDNDDVNVPGVKEITVYITNPQTGEKVKQDKKIYVYIVKEPYISNKSVVLFEFGQQVDMTGGSSWKPIVVEEIADEVTKTIVNKIHTGVVFSANGFTTSVGGNYTVGFSATIISHKDGIKVVVKPTTGTAVVQSYDAASAAAMYREQGVAEQRFWVEASEILHLSKANESWQLDDGNYKTGGEKLGALKANKNYDRILTVDAAGHPRMSSEILVILKEQTNSQLVVNYGELKLTLHSKDFKGYKTDPSGYYDLGLKTGNNNEGINKLVGTRSQQQLEFDMNKDLVGKATITVKLNDALKNSKSINLFNYNEGANQLELVGKMTNNGNGTASIKLSAIRENYVILSGLSKSTDKKATAGEKVLSYRITEKTIDMTASYKAEVEKDLKSTGKTIKSITTLDADEKTIARIETEQEIKLLAKESKLNTIGAIAGVGILLIGIAAYVLIRKKDSLLKEEDAK